jgi:hypothetical protein
VWTTREKGVHSIASPAVAAGSVFAGTAAVKDRRIAEGHVRLTGPVIEDAPTNVFGSRPIAALRHFPSMFEGEHDRPTVYELVRLQAEDVQTSPVWEGESALAVFDDPVEPLATLRPRRVDRGWRYSLALTNRHNHLLPDLRGIDTH